MGQEQPAEYYDRIYRTSASYAVEPDASRWYPLWSWVAARVGELAPAMDAWVLDLGCGPGHLAKMLSGPRVFVCGVDSSPVALEQARRRCPDGVFLFRAITPAWLGSVATGEDVITACEFLEHVEDDMGLVERAMSAGVPLVATLPTFDDPGHVRHFPDEASVRERYGAWVRRLEAIDAHHWGVVMGAP